MGQLANSADNLVTACWNDIGLLEDRFRRMGERIAAVVMEPVLCNSGCLPPRDGYLKAVRAMCDRAGALLIFDEVITGFRIRLGGAQEAFGVVPDIATLGKALGGGVPVSAIVGRADIMDKVKPGTVAYGGTFNGNPLSLAGTRACLDTLADDGRRPLDRANRAGERIIAAVPEIARKHGLDVRVTGFGAAFALHFTRRSGLHDYRDTLDDNRALLSSFLLHALHQGLYLLPDGRFYVSAAHTDRDIDEAIAALGRTFASLASDGVEPARA